MKKLYLKSLLLLILTLGVLLFLDSKVIHSALFSQYYREYTAGNEPSDFVYLGNSISQRSFNHHKIDSLLGTKSYCLGSPGQHFYVTYAIFNELIKDKNTHPKQLLLVSISPNQFVEVRTDKQKFSQMKVIDELPFSLEKIKLIHTYYDIDEYPEAWSSSIRFHDILHEKIYESPYRLKAAKDVDRRGFSKIVTTALKETQKAKQNDLNSIAATYSERLDATVIDTIDLASQTYIKDMIRKAEIHDINLVFYTAPSISYIREKKLLGQMKMMELFIKENSGKYINLNRLFNELHLTVDDFSDYTHLNIQGNSKIVPVFTDSILPMFHLEKN